MTMSIANSIEMTGEVAVEFDSLLPDSDLFWIDKCGHAAMMEHPQEFNNILDNWLNKRDL